MLKLTKEEQVQVLIGRIDQQKLRRQTYLRSK